MGPLFTPIDKEIILQGFFALLTGFITIWALSWASVIKRDDPRSFRILHLFSGVLLLSFFGFSLDLTGKQFFVLLASIIVVCVVSAEFTIRIPNLRDGTKFKLVTMQITHRSIAKLRDRIDLERNAVLLEIFNGAEKANIRHYLQNAYDSIIEDTIPRLLKEARIRKKFNISLLVPADDGKFRVRSSTGVNESHLTQIEETFNWKDPVVGLAGYCFARKENISVVDLSQPEFSEILDYWVELTPNEKPHDSFYANPIVFGNPIDEDSIVVAVLCVTVRGKNAWKSDNIGLMMEMISESIESLMYIEKILDIPDYDKMV